MTVTSKSHGENALILVNNIKQHDSKQAMIDAVLFESGTGLSPSLDQCVATLLG